MSAPQADYPGKDWFFWSDREKDNLLTYPDSRQLGYGNGILDGLFLRPMRHIASMVPDTVAPNVLTVAGLVCLMHGAYLSDRYSESYPLLISIVCGVLSLGYYVMDAIDGMHAVRVRNTSNIGSLIVTAVNSVAPVLLTIMLCRAVLGITDNLCIWYAVQGTQLFFIFIHVCELYGSQRSFVRTFIPGPAALVPLFPVLCGFRALLEVAGDDILLENWWKFVRFVEGIVGTGEDAQLNSWRSGFQALCVMMLVAVVFACLRGGKKQRAEGADVDTHYISQTQTRLLICVAYRMVPGIMLKLGMRSAEEVALPAVIVDGLFMSVLCTDIVVSKMARRSLHSWVVIFCMISVMDPFVETLLCAAYFWSVFHDLSMHSHMPIFTIQRNIYVDGIYDLCHIGHMRMFAASAQFGNALFVGVINDEDATPYKRKPVMTHEERCIEVGACKYVTKVIPNAPCDGITREFVEAHNIHLVVCGEEYFVNPNDKYYREPREMGILKCAPRTEGMSTSNLINRILEVDATSLMPKDKLRGDSTVVDPKLQEQQKKAAAAAPVPAPSAARQKSVEPAK